MSDLISRSEVLIAMDTWDKFGYDEHNRLIKIDITNEEYVPYVHYEDMVKCVNDMPTAYDIDKVVEELEKASWEETDISTVIYIDDAIEIVKHGGVADDMCEWRCDVYERWHTKCNILADNDPLEYTYCPYCGKKIKVVE